MSGEIAIVCNSRAERGPLESVIAALPDAHVLSVDASGMTPEQGMRMALFQFDAMLKTKPFKLVIVLGDRYETLGAALAAFFLRIPIAHIHGGETTTGAFDDALRHSISHMATLHFCPTAKAFHKLSMMGFDRGALFRVGAPGLDGIPQNSARRDHKNLVLVTFHPETMAEDYGVANCRAMLSAFDDFTGAEFIFCGINSDPGGLDVGSLQKQWCAESMRGIWRDDLNHAEYVALMQKAALVIGNSSAGVIEAPWVGVPSVNIGNRQDGRPPSPSVFYAKGDEREIGYCIKRALAFRGDPAPAYQGGAAPKIAAICREFVERGKVEPMFYAGGPNGFGSATPLEKV